MLDVEVEEEECQPKCGQQAAFKEAIKGNDVVCGLFRSLPSPLSLHHRLSASRFPQSVASLQDAVVVRIRYHQRQDTQTVDATPTGGFWNKRAGFPTWS
jgi:hypothetical protein